MSTTLRDETGLAWEVAQFFPNRGQWAETDFLMLSHMTNRPAEFAAGRVEALPMPTKTHQRIVLYLYNAMLAFVSSRNAGEVLVAPYPVRLGKGKFREPDIIFMLAAHRDRLGEEYAEGADLVMEVVSDENRAHDLVTKRAEYAEAGIPEYWIVDPRERTITVLTLQTGKYEIHVESGAGQQADSVLLPGFTVDVAAVFEAAAAGK